mgnify:FL=1
MKKKMTACALLLLLLLTACGQKPSLQETIPTLSLTAGGGRTAPVNAYDYSWQSGREAVVVDTAHPLQTIETLPGVTVPAGASIGMRFSRLPDRVIVACWPESMAETSSPWQEQELESTFVNNLFTFTPPESEENLIFLVHGYWDSYEDVSGSVGYAFVIEQN